MENLDLGDTILPATLLCEYILDLLLNINLLRLILRAIIIKVFNVTHF